MPSTNSITRKSSDSAATDMRRYRSAGCDMSEGAHAFVVYGLQRFDTVRVVNAPHDFLFRLKEVPPLVLGLFDDFDGKP